ncbi:MAG: single-stranded DNA-binding protein [Arthrobacter sp.]|jgi:single-strand DNA-binding protein|nr:single-stranded DNA-binding protein [Arthrobacter sp.]
MSETITVRGFVATDPDMRVLESGLQVASFRLGSTPRRFDRTAGVWVDGETSWYTVSCFRELAVNAKVSLKKGQPIVVLGRLKVRQFTRNDGSPGVSVELDAETLGYDLRFGTGTFGRTQREAAPGQGQPAEGAAAAGEAGHGEAADAEAAPAGAGTAYAPGYGPGPDAQTEGSDAQAERPDAGREPGEDDEGSLPGDDDDEAGVDLLTGEIGGRAA